VDYSMSYLNHYFDNLSFQFLFIKGDGNPKFSTQAVGQMYIWEFPFLIAGIIFIFRKREGNWWIIPLWLVLAITPAATARETPHALRIETTLPTFQILVAYGIVQFFSLISNLKIKYLIVFCFLIGVTFNVVYFWENYTQHYPKQFAQEWQYGYKDAILYASNIQDNYNKIYVTKGMGRPYVYTLFYEKYNPELFRKEAVIKRDPFGFVNVPSFGKYYFDKDYLGKSKKVLYIDPLGDVPKNAIVKKTFYSRDGTPVLKAYTVD